MICNFDRNKLFVSFCCLFVHLGDWSFLFISQRRVLTRNVLWNQTWILCFELFLDLPHSSLGWILRIFLRIWLERILSCLGLFHTFLISFILNKFINPWQSIFAYIIRGMSNQILRLILHHFHMSIDITCYKILVQTWLI